MAILADGQFCIYADIVGGSEKVQKYADVIIGIYVSRFQHFMFLVHCIG